MARVTFTWRAPTSRTDGSPIADGMVYRLYEDGNLIVDEIAVTNFSIVDAPEGTRQYYVTAFSPSTGLESEPSPVVTVRLVKPAAPTDLAFSIG